MVDKETLEQVTVWELQTQIQVLVHKLKCINMQRRRLRAQAPFIKKSLEHAEECGMLRGFLNAKQYNNIIDDVCEE